MRIYDYVDVGVPLLERMFQKRLRGYHAMGYLNATGREYQGTRQAEFPRSRSAITRINLPVEK